GDRWLGVRVPHRTSSPVTSHSSRSTRAGHRSAGAPHVCVCRPAAPLRRFSGCDVLKAVSSPPEMAEKALRADCGRLYACMAAVWSNGECDTEGRAHVGSPRSVLVDPAVEKIGGGAGIDGPGGRFQTRAQIRGEVVREARVGRQGARRVDEDGVSYRTLLAVDKVFENLGVGGGVATP